MPVFKAAVLIFAAAIFADAQALGEPFYLIRIVRGAPRRRRRPNRHPALYRGESADRGPRNESDYGLIAVVADRIASLIREYRGGRKGDCRSACERVYAS